MVRRQLAEVVNHSGAHAHRYEIFIGSRPESFLRIPFLVRRILFQRFRPRQISIQSFIGDFHVPPKSMDQGLVKDIFLGRDACCFQTFINLFSSDSPSLVTGDHKRLPPAEELVKNF